MRLSQALVHFVIDRAKLFTDHRISGLPIRAKYKHFRTIWEDTFDNDAWSRYFVKLLSRLVCQLTISLHTFLFMTFHITRPWRNTKILRLWKFFSSTRGNSRFKHGSVNCPQYLCLFHINFECSPSIHDPIKMLVLPNRLLCWVISTSDQDFVSFQPIFISSSYTDKNNPFHRVRLSIPNWKPSPNHYVMLWVWHWGHVQKKKNRHNLCATNGCVKIWPLQMAVL